MRKSYKDFLRETFQEYDSVSAPLKKGLFEHPAITALRRLMHSENAIELLQILQCYLDNRRKKKNEHRSIAYFFWITFFCKAFYPGRQPIWNRHTSQQCSLAEYLASIFGTYSVYHDDTWINNLVGLQQLLGEGYLSQQESSQVCDALLVMGGEKGILWLSDYIRLRQINRYQPGAGNKAAECLLLDSVRQVYKTTINRGSDEFFKLLEHVDVLYPDIQFSDAMIEYIHTWLLFVSKKAFRHDSEFKKDHDLTSISFEFYDTFLKVAKILDDNDYLNEIIMLCRYKHRDGENTNANVHTGFFYLVHILVLSNVFSVSVFSILKRKLSISPEISTNRMPDEIAFGYTDEKMRIFNQGSDLAVERGFINTNYLCRWSRIAFIALHYLFTCQKQLMHDRLVEALLESDWPLRFIEGYVEYTNFSKHLSLDHLVILLFENCENRLMDVPHVDSQFYKYLASTFDDYVESDQLDFLTCKKFRSIMRLEPLVSYLQHPLLLRLQYFLVDNADKMTIDQILNAQRQFILRWNIFDQNGQNSFFLKMVWHLLASHIALLKEPLFISFSADSDAVCSSLQQKFSEQAHSIILSNEAKTFSMRVALLQHTLFLWSTKHQQAGVPRITFFHDTRFFTHVILCANQFRDAAGSYRLPSELWMWVVDLILTSCIANISKIPQPSNQV